MNTNNLNIDIQTKSLLQNGGIEHVSADFTDKVMSKINMAQKPLLASYTPVINKKGWFLISSFMSLIIIVFIITSSMSTKSGNVDTSKYFDVFASFMNSISDYTSQIFSSFSIYAIFIPLLLLFFFFLDKLLQKATDKEL